MAPAALIVDDWLTLRRATRPGAIRSHLATAMREEGLVMDEELFLDAFDYASAFHRTMTERDLREHTVEQVLSLAMYTVGSPTPPTDPVFGRVSERALERNAEHVQWYEDAVPFLNAAKESGIRTALVSNTIFGLGRPWEKRLAEWFPTRILSREIGFVKPHPGMFLEASRTLGVDPKDCLYVGDLLLSDVWGAQKVGMKAVHLDRREEEQSMFRASDARLAANLGVDLASVTPDARADSLRAVMPLLR